MGKCEICGKPTRFNYKLCAECYKKENEDVENNQVENEEDYEEGSDCILCGEEANGYLFCKTCYYKYKNKVLFLKVTNCEEFEVVGDEYNNLKYSCDDGRKVRSKSEKIMSDFFFKNKIRAVYEKEVYYTEKGEDKILHPDFYLPDYDLYIEHNGFTGKRYKEQKAYSERIYKELNLSVIITTEEDLQNIEKCLKPKLGLH